MSKLVKQLMMDDLQSRLQGVGDVFVVSLGQLDAQKTTDLRLTLRKKNISLQLIKNALAKRVLAETPLAPALENLSGMLALCWGGEDVVDLAKELNRLAELDGFEQIECRGGAMDGSKLEPDDLKRSQNGRREQSNSLFCLAKCCRRARHYPGNSWAAEAHWQAKSRAEWKS
jgi:ribosomal protein L10